MSIARSRPAIYQMGERTTGVDHSVRVSAIREVVRVSDALRKLHGANAPARKSVTHITEDALVQDMCRLEEELANSRVDTSALIAEDIDA